jgi:hypothetical protein
VQNISIKALLSGIISIVIMGLVLQLVFLLLATSYTVLLKEQPALAPLATVLSYAAGIAAYFFIMSFGGYITAHLAQQRVDLHCIIVSSCVTGFSLITSLSSDRFTYISILFAVSGLVFAIIGGRTWIKHSLADAN